MTIPGLITEARSAGVVLVLVPPDRLKARYDTPPPADLLAVLQARKGELIAYLSQTARPSCGKPTDEKQRCWACHDRRCSECGRSTASAFIELCFTCQHRIEQGQRAATTRGTHAAAH